MTRAYNVVDADGHILEPLDLWDRYIDPEFRERRPRFVIDDNGKERLSVEGKLLGNPRGIGSLGSVGVRQGIVKANSLKYAERRRGGFDPHARMAMHPIACIAAFATAMPSAPSARALTKSAGVRSPPVTIRVTSPRSRRSRWRRARASAGIVGTEMLSRKIAGAAPVPPPRPSRIT